MTEDATINVTALRRDGETLLRRQLFSDLMGEVFMVTYSLTACEAGLDKDDFSLVVYGIKVDKYTTGGKCTLVETATTPYVTTSLSVASEMIDILARNEVTPITLHDVISDLLQAKRMTF